MSRIQHIEVPVWLAVVVVVLVLGLAVLAGLQCEPRADEGPLVSESSAARLF